MEITIKLDSSNQGDLMILALLNKHLKIQTDVPDQSISPQPTIDPTPIQPPEKKPASKPVAVPDPEPAPPPKPKAKTSSKPVEEMDFSELAEIIKADGADAVKAKFLAKRYVMDHNGDKEPLIKILQEINANSLLDLKTKKDLTIFCDRAIALVEAENGSL